VANQLGQLGFGGEQRRPCNSATPHKRLAAPGDWRLSDGSRPRLDRRYETMV